MKHYKVTALNPEGKRVPIARFLANSPEEAIELAKADIAKTAEADKYADLQARVVADDDVMLRGREAKQALRTIRGEEDSE